MGVLTVLLLIIFVISAILLIILVLMQDEQGEGLGGIFGGGSATPFGSRSGNVLTKTTSILAVIFLLSSFGLAWVNKTPETSDVEEAARNLENQEAEYSDWWDTSNPDNAETEGSETEGTEPTATDADTNPSVDTDASMGEDR